MLPKKFRIPRKLFSELLLNSKYVNSPRFSLRFNFSPKILETRIGVSVSKKISKSAVVRNTLRRRVYSTMQPYLSEMESGLYLFVAKQGAEKLKGQALKDELERLVVKS